MFRKLNLFLATGFCVGYLPCVPGTFGTVVGMGIFFSEFYLFGSNAIFANAVFFVLMLVPSILIAGKAEGYFKKKDAQQIVIDEIMGYSLSVLFHPFSIKLAVCAFVLFRIFDILKPFPIKKLQNIHGGLGVVADDLLAGVFVNVCLWGVVLIGQITGHVVI